MKTLRPFLLVLYLVLGVAARQGANVDVAKTNDDDLPASKVPVRSGKVEIPPEKARPINIPKTTAAPTIDGHLDEEVWKQAALFKDFYQTGPGYNTPPSKQTEAYITYDEKFLYVAFKCWDERDKIRATVAKRDNVFGEDNVRMWLDTYNDQRRAYVLGFNPLGIQQDGIYTEGTGADFSVDIVMESKGVIEDWGWSVEIKIPFKSLRYAAGKGKFWGFNCARNIDRFNDEFDQWLPDDRDVSGFLIKHGRITGLDIKYEKTLEVVPSITVSQTGLRKRTIPNAGFATFGVFDPIFNPIGLRDPGKFTNDPVKQDIGVNLKYSMSPNVTLDAALNPDYAEIEADAPVVAANQRFPIFFQEKRPFFLEGKDIFETPLQPFYSRTIVDPDVAVKLTGKTGKNTFGVLVASDNAPGNYSEDERGELRMCQEGRADDILHNRPPRGCSGIEEFVDKNATFGVLRVKHDFGKENNVGFFATARTFPKDRNFLGGFDGKFKLDPKTTMTFQALETYSKKFFYDPVRDSVDYRVGNGFGYFWSLDYTADTTGWYIEATGKTKDYQADAGFTRRIGTNSVFASNRFSTKSNPKATMIRFDWRQFGRYTFDWKGRRQDGVIGSGLNVQMQGNVFISAEAGFGFEKIYEEEFGALRNPLIGQQGGFAGEPTRATNQPYFSFNINKRVNKQLFVYGFIGSIFDAFDYDFGGGYRYPRASAAFQTYLSSPEYAEYLRQLYLFQANPVGDHPPLFDIAPPPQLDPGKGYQFDTNVGFEYKPVNPFTISLDYTKSKLTRDDTGRVAYDTNIFSLRSVYQFTRFTYVRARWDYDTLSSGASGQFLLGWNPNPGTAFYVGYNDTFNYNGFSPLTNHAEPGFARNSRTIFIRASYLFRKSY
jgi:Domain of unknown function (DUF5916)/Carbohydrate family 9 binding domain-like